MLRRRRSAVLVVQSNAVGHELIFRHYTNKVVVGKYPEPKATKFSEKGKQQTRKKADTD